MSIPAFLPNPVHVKKIAGKNLLTMAQLCEQAGIPCRASGDWVNRKVYLTTSKVLSVKIASNYGRDVQIALPKSSKLARARMALGIMAYSVFDPVARSSIARQPWSQISAPMSLSQTMKALGNA